MTIYKGKKSYMVGDQNENALQVLAAAKKKFKKAEANIAVNRGYISGDDLYIEDPELDDAKVVFYAEVR